jgi:hypothetical protein
MSLGSATGIVLAAVLSAGAPSGSPAAEVLGVVPSDMAACLIVENAAAHFERFRKSHFFDRACQLPFVRQWQQSPDYAKLKAAETLLPALLGIDLATFRDKIVGQCVVLAFRPGPSLDRPGIGILLCRAADDDAISRLFHALGQSAPGRTVRRYPYRGVEIIARTERNERTQHLVRLGLIAAMSDHEPAIRQVIDASLDAKGFGTTPAYSWIRQSLPANCLMRLIVSPRVLDPYFERWSKQAKGPQARVAAFVFGAWKRLRWTALSLSIQDQIEFGWHGALEPAQAGDESQRAVLTAGSDFWKRVSQDALFAVFAHGDFAAIAGLLKSFFADEANDDVRALFGVLSQLLAGYEIERDLLPRLGPQIGLSIEQLAGPAGLSLLLAIQFRDHQPGDSARIPLSSSLEAALRPLLVVVGIEHNKTRKDKWSVTLRTEDGVRIHHLHGSQKLPNWFEPGFAVHGGFILFSTSPTAITLWLRRVPHDADRFANVQQFFANWAPSDFIAHMYLNVSALRNAIRRYHEGLIGIGADAVAQSGRPLPDNLSALLDVLDLFERVVIGRRVEPAGTFHWTLSIFTRPVDRG